MRVLLATGIWPPDVGGPATHGPELARFLAARGHEVCALTMADAAPTERPCPVHLVPRRLPFSVRYPLLAARAAALARRAEVVYASAAYAAAAAGAAAARRPLLVKLVSDPAFERARRLGIFAGTLEQFQDAPGAAIATLRTLRTRVLGAAAAVSVPSAYLAAMARAWGLPAERIVVVPNAAPLPLDQAPGPVEPGLFAFVGRLTRQKRLELALEALARVEAARLVVVGEGPDREALERRARELGLGERVSFAGRRSRAEVLETLAGAYAAVLPSAWENLPHAAVEALAVGTPVVATAVGGVPEVVRHGENGLLVAPGSADELAAALRRLVSDPALRDRLAANARPSVVELAPERVFPRIEALLAEVAGR